MAQINITLNQDEITLNQDEIQLLLENNSGEAFRRLLQESLNSVLRAESAEQLHANPYERTEERTDCRNGVRERKLNTRIGSITLQVPRHRGQPFKTMIFENYSRSEAALVAGMAEMVVNGVSTRKVSQVMETLCGTGFSKSTVSELCKDLDKSVKEFRDRPLTGEYPFLTLDATYFKVREKHRILSKAFMIALGTDQDGHREIVGFGVYPNESRETWKEFLLNLQKRGLSGMLLVTSDAHEGIRYALGKVYPNVPWQRCQFHFSKNISEKAPKKYQAGIRAELQEMFNCETIAAARKKRDSILASYSDVAESAMRCLEEGFESSMTVMELPKSLRRFFRTSNHIERLNRELKRRSKVIGVFPNEASLLRLMGAVLEERNAVIQNGKAVFSKSTYGMLLESETPVKLALAAQEQQRLLAIGIA